MTPVETILSGLALAFCWVQYLNPFNGRPFNCIKCMAGWCSLAVYCLSTCITQQYNMPHYAAAPLYLAAGVLTGAIFEAITMRWL